MDVEVVEGGPCCAETDCGVMGTPASVATFSSSSLAIITSEPEGSFSARIISAAMDSDVS